MNQRIPSVANNDTSLNSIFVTVVSRKPRESMRQIVSGSGEKKKWFSRRFKLKLFFGIRLIMPALHWLRFGRSARWIHSNTRWGRSDCHRLLVSGLFSIASTAVLKIPSWLSIHAVHARGNWFGIRVFALAHHLMDWIIALSKLKKKKNANCYHLRSTSPLDLLHSACKYLAWIGIHGMRTNVFSQKLRIIERCEDKAHRPMAAYLR